MKKTAEKIKFTIGRKINEKKNTVFNYVINIYNVLWE